MVTDSLAAMDDSSSAHGVIGTIPVRNIWWLMLYASELFRVKGDKFVGTEEMPDELPNLIGKILAHAVEQRQRQRLSFGYRTTTAELGRVRGRIDVLATERRQLLARGLVACRYEEFTIDTTRNRFVRAALERISRLPVQPEVRRRCRKLANNMKMMGVSGVSPTIREISADRFGRHDAKDQEMVAAAKLAFELAIPTESAGRQKLPILKHDDHWARKLFEKAIGGFFEVVLPYSQPGHWEVIKGKKLGWSIETHSDGINQFFPNMKTDIILESLVARRRIVIDTKFTAITKDGQYRETLNSGYIYQMYAYLRSQDGIGDEIADNAEGVLLHPSVGTDIDEYVVVQGHKIRFMTVDLAASPSKIRSDLLKVVTG